MVNIHVPLGFLDLRCRNCGNTTWKVKVLPQLNMAKICKVECLNCNEGLRVASDGFIECNGIVGIPGKTLEKVEKVE